MPAAPPRLALTAVSRLRAGLRRLERRLAPPPVPALELASGFWRACAVGALVRLGVPDGLAEGPRDVRALARDVGADEDALFRLLRALADDGVLARTGRTFALTAVSQPLRTGAPGSVAASAAQMTAEWNLRAWAGLAESVRTGRPAFPRQQGTDLWAYLADHPHEGRYFHRSMQELSRLDVASLLAAHDFGRHTTVVDVGGGSGELLAGVLAAHPHLRGVLHDLPSALEEAPDVLDRAGVADRCTVIAGDFRAEVPRGGDVHLLRQVTHGPPTRSSPPCSPRRPAARAAARARHRRPRPRLGRGLDLPRPADARRERRPGAHARGVRAAARRRRVPPRRGDPHAGADVRTHRGAHQPRPVADRRRPVACDGGGGLPAGRGRGGRARGSTP